MVECLLDDRFLGVVDNREPSVVHFIGISLRKSASWRHLDDPDHTIFSLNDTRVVRVLLQLPDYLQIGHDLKWLKTNMPRTIGGNLSLPSSEAQWRTRSGKDMRFVCIGIFDRRLPPCYLMVLVLVPERSPD